jgi:hypothetical protein
LIRLLKLLRENLFTQNVLYDFIKAFPMLFDIFPSIFEFPLAKEKLMNTSFETAEIPQK